MIRRFARPYARAISEIIPADEARKVFDELTRFEKARRKSTDLQEMLDHPGIDANRKNAVIDQIGAKLGISLMGLRILKVLTGNHRINALGAVLEAWRELINKVEGVAVAEVRVAHTLNDIEKQQLRKALESRFGKKVDLELTVDAALLAGFVAKVGSEVYDASVTGRIEKLRQSMHQ